MRALLLILLPAVALADTVLKDEGTSQGPISTINCSGTGITCTRSGSTGTLSISGGAGLVCQEEGSSLTARPAINFIGPAITAADNAGSARTDVTVVASGVGSCAAGSYASATNNGAAPTCSNAPLTFTTAPTVSSFTQGSVIFAGASGLLSQDNPNLFYDDTNNRLGLGTNAPDSPLHIKAPTNDATLAVRVRDSADVSRFEVESDGSILSKLHVGGTEVGTLTNGTPNSQVGWIFTDPAGTSRTDIRLLSGGGLEFAPGTGSGIPTTRMALDPNGGTSWAIKTGGGVEQGTIDLGTPGGVAGVFFRNSSGTGRSDWRHVSGGGFQWGAGTGSGAPTMTMALNTSGALSSTSLVATGTSGTVLTVDTNVILADATNNRVGINKTPTVALDVSGAIAGSSTITATSTVTGSGLVATGTSGNTLAVEASSTTGVVYDATNNRFGVLTNAPSFALDVRQGAVGTTSIHSTGDIQTTAAAATSGATAKHAPDLLLRATYWNGSASTNYDFRLKHEMVDTAPSSSLGFYFNGVSQASLTNLGGLSLGDSLIVGTTAIINGTLTMAGAIDLDDPGAKPACDSTQRGKIWMDEGGAGVKDSVEVCAKAADDSYAWRVIY